MRDLDRTKPMANKASEIFLLAVSVVADRGAVEPVPPAGDPGG